jgi:DnaJ-class molecular chaperone
MLSRVEAASILGVNQNAPEADIKRAYRKAALRWHPDKNHSPEAPDKFKQITDAYNLLLKPETFQFFDDIEAEAEELFNMLNTDIFFFGPKPKTLNFRVRIKIEDIWKNTKKYLPIQDRSIDLPLYYSKLVLRGHQKVNIHVIDKNSTFKRRGLWDLETTLPITLMDLYRDTTLSLKLPDNKIIKIKWKKSFLSNIKNEKHKGFFLFHYGLPTPEDDRGKLWIRFNVLLSDNFQKKKDEEINGLEPEWASQEEWENDKLLSRKSVIKID